MDIMLDLETFGKTANAVIVQIGACFFDLTTGEIDPEKFLVNVDAASCLYHGMTVDASTLYWWFSQSDKARDHITSDPKYHIANALMGLTKFSKKTPFDRVWCHTTFDAPILNNAYEKVSLENPFSYRVFKDIRTLMDLSNFTDKVPFQGIKHDALCDCIHQVQYCHMAYKKLRNLL